jgi:nucleoid-associated protein YgaU
MKRDPRRRYSTTPRFAAAPGQPPVFPGLMPRRILPKSGHILHQVIAGDRLDRLAQRYYGDGRLWWVIAQANPEVGVASDLLYINEITPDARVHLRIGTDIAIPPRPEDAE